MKHVPLEFRTLREGSISLQHHTSGLYIYFSAATIIKACEAGLHNIVADGMRSLHPETLRYPAQLHCVHSVCSRRVEEVANFGLEEVNGGSRRMGRSPVLLKDEVGSPQAQLRSESSINTPPRGPKQRQETLKRVQERRAKIAEEIRLFEEAYWNGQSEQEIKQSCRKFDLIRKFHIVLLLLYIILKCIMIRFPT
ncbi:hypothetical protein V3C99_018468 [Haemonchus contortus]|uniref:Uncharacterized protein n=1 Tax=Haemonchus contortus TaxID=6289 RepID=A0A7I4Z1V8_HAECO